MVLRESIFELPDKDMDKIPPQAVSCSLKAWFPSIDVILKQDEAIDKFKEVLSGVSGDTSLFAILRKNNNRTGKDEPQYFAEISEEESLLQSRLIEENPNPVPNPKVINKVSEWLQSLTNDHSIKANLPNMRHSYRGTNIELKNKHVPDKHNPNSQPLMIAPTINSKYYQETTKKPHEPGTILLNNACHEGNHKAEEAGRTDQDLGDDSLDSIAGGVWSDKKRNLVAKSIKVLAHLEEGSEEMSDEMTPLRHGLKITNIEDYVTDLATITIDNDDVEEECVIEYGVSPHLFYVHLLGMKLVFIKIYCCDYFLIF